MNDQIKKRVKSDLVIAFGFSKDNAELALSRYENHELDVREIDAIQYLINKDPFHIGVEHLVFPEVMIETLERLNYKISTERD